MTTEAEQLALARERLAALGRADWSVSEDNSGRFLETRTARGMLLRICDFDPGATEAEVAFIHHAPAAMRLLLALVDRAIATLRTARQGGTASAVPREGEGGRRPDHAAECAMRCADPAFRVWLEERHGLERPLTDERVAQRVRSLLGVTSRAALNDDDAAAARWREMKRDFKAWRAGR